MTEHQLADLERDDEDAALADAGADLWSRWRWPASVAAVAACLFHLPVMDEHLSEAPYMGVLFAVFSLVVLGLAAAIQLADTPRRYLLLGSWCLLAVLTYAATRLVAFPQLEHDVGQWIELWGLLAIGAELTAVACCAAALHAGRRRA